MFALFQNEWVVAGTVIGVFVIGLIGWRRFGGWIIGGRRKAEETANKETA